MTARLRLLALLAAAGASAAGWACIASAQGAVPRLEGASAFGDWRADRPGLWRHIGVDDLPAPGATPSSAAMSSLAPRPAGSAPQVPSGFAVTAYASGLEEPRVLRVAPNGDLFVAESAAGRVRVLRPGADPVKPAQVATFATGLSRPYGIAFYPEADPQWVYVANTNSVVRFPYRAGDLAARGPAQVVVAKLSEGSGGHWTRDLVFSRDGKRMFVSVGSGSNVAEGMGAKSAEAVRQWQAGHALGAAWGPETDRADVLSFTPDGGDRKVFATGIRNCARLSRNPQTGDLWCSTNERDALGDNLVPDYVTRVQEGRFYGWPWYYMGNHQDPRLKGARPDLAGKITVPDVLLQPHSAALQTAFYPTSVSGPSAFPPEYRGDGFTSLHGSWNRAARTGYKIVRVKLNNGRPTGDYQDFMTGFVADAKTVWGRPVGVAVGRDGALYVSDDGSGTVWRVAYVGKR